LDSTGNPDATFGTNGISVVDVGGSGYMYGAGVAWQLDGRIVVAGLGGGGTGKVGVARLSPSGTLESSNFISSEGKSNPELILLPDGTMWVASSMNFAGRLERFRTLEQVTATANVTVADNDTPPIVANDSYTVFEDTTLSVTVPATGAGITSLVMSSEAGD